jgi:hypothetical protein
MTIAAKQAIDTDAEGEFLDPSELLEDEDEDTGVLRIRYAQSMDKLKATRVDIAKIKSNIPAPSKT